MVNRHILISGAGAAGQSVAYWLRRFGFEPTVIERAEGPRTGGFAIDLRGSAVQVADRMGILEGLRDVRVRMREIAFVDHDGGLIAKMDGNFGAGEGEAGDIELLREDLNNALQSAIPADTEYIYGESVTSLDQDADGVWVTLKNGGRRRFDLVIGADGQHSNIRSLAFGPEREFAKPLGYYVGVFTIPNILKLDRQWFHYNVPDRHVGVLQYGQDKHTRAMFIFASPPLEYDRGDIGAQKAIIESVFAGESGWCVQALLRELQRADDLYFDDVTQIRMDRWHNGRSVVLGDAGYAPTLITGQGTSLAVVGGYVLAGELKKAGGDYAVAFPRYEQVMRGYVEQNQAIALGADELRIPSSWEEIEGRNDMLRRMYETEDVEQFASESAAEGSAGDLIQRAANAIELERYETDG